MSDQKKTDFDWTQIKKSGIFTGIVILFLALLIVFTLLSRFSWKKGLSNEVTAVLNSGEDTYVCGDFVPLKSLMNTNCAVYQVEKKAEDGKKSTEMFAAIVRVTTMYGPVPAVFLWDESKQTADFFSYVDIKGNTLKQITEITRNSQITYWEKRIPYLIQTSSNLYQEEK